MDRNEEMNIGQWVDERLDTLNPERMCQPDVQRGLARSEQSRGERAERAAIERRFATLTSRERDVLRLVVTGLLNKQIAGELGIAEKTVKIHRGQVMQKMEAGSVAELVPMAQKLGLTGSPSAPAH